MSAGSPDSADPAERPAALAELGPDEERHEAGEVEGVRHAGALGPAPGGCCRSRRRPRRLPQGEHRPRPGPPSARMRPALVHVGLGPPQGQRVASVISGRDVAAERVVRGRLVGHGVEPLALRAPSPAAISAALPTRAIESGSPRGGRHARQSRAPRRAVREPIDVADLVAPPGPRLVDLDARSPRRRSSSPPAAGRRPSRRGRPSGRPARAASRRSAGAPARRTSRRCPAGSPGSRCRSRSRPSSGRTSSGRPARARGSAPRSPTCRPGSSSRSGPAAPTGCVRKTPTGLPDWTRSVSSSARCAKLADDRVERLPGARGAARPAVDDERVRVLARPRGRGCS